MIDGKKIESEFMDTMIQSFDYMDVIKKLVECENILILKGIRKVVEDKIKCLEDGC